MITRKRYRLATEASAVTTEEDSLNLLSILPFVLKSSAEENPLPVSTKHCLRLVCKAAKAAVDPYLLKVKISTFGNVLSNTDLFKTFHRSSLTAAAKHVSSEAYLSRKDMIKFNRIPFKHAEHVDLAIQSGALDLLPRHKWDTLLKLELTVEWYYDIHSREKFNTFWKSFFKAKWPLLESLTIEIEPEEGGTDEDFYEDEPDPELGAAANLLSYFPKLKTLKVKSAVSLSDVKALAAIPHNNLESLQLGFTESNFIEAGALAEAKWPNLKELILSDLPNVSAENMATLMKAPWILKLKTIYFSPDVLFLDVAQEFIGGLSGGEIESLELKNTRPDVFSAFHNVELLKLKVLTMSMERPSVDDAEDDNEAFSQGLSCFFSTAKMPCLEFFNISIYSYRYRDHPISWKKAPACAKAMEEEPFSIFPSLNLFTLSGLTIGPECAKFLASGFYKRGCDVDLTGALVESGIDTAKLAETLIFYRISKAEFDEELKDLEIYNEVYWYNLYSIEELQTIAASRFLANLAADLDNVVEPAKRSLAVAVDKSNEMDLLLQKRYKATLEALARVNTVAIEVGKGEDDSGSDADGGASASRSGGGGGGGGRKKRPPSAAAAL